MAKGRCPAKGNPSQHGDRKVLFLSAQFPRCSALLHITGFIYTLPQRCRCRTCKKMLGMNALGRSTTTRPSRTSRMAGGRRRCGWRRCLKLQAGKRPGTLVGDTLTQQPAKCCPLGPRSDKPAALEWDLTVASRTMRERARQRCNIRPSTLSAIEHIQESAATAVFTTRI